MPPTDDLARVQLTKRLHLWQRRRGHRTGTDDVIAAWAALSAAPSPGQILDLGAGHGSVSLLMAEAMPAARITAVEIQEVSWALLQRNIDENDLAERITPLHGDLRSLSLGGSRFDLVTGTPPFMPVGSGVPPRDPQRAAARFELHGGIEDYCTAGARHLAPGGIVSLVMDAARPGRYVAAFAGAGLHLHRTVEVLPRPGAPPTYLVYQARRAPSPAPPARDTLVVRGDDDRWTDELVALRHQLGLPAAKP